MNARQLLVLGVAALAAGTIALIEASQPKPVAVNIPVPGVTAAPPVLPAQVIPHTTGILPSRDAPASDLIDYARRVAGSKFAGMWLTDQDVSQFRIAIVGPTASDSARIQRALRSIGTAGRVVPAKFTERKLVQITSYLSLRLARVNRSAEASINVGIRPDQNAVELGVPPLQSVSAAQRALIEAAVSNFKSAVRLKVSSAARNTVLPCRDVFCDPPLRSGIWTYAGLVGCTGSFLARSRSDGRLYQMTAGHCGVVLGSTWVTQFVNGIAHSIGRVKNRRFDITGDMGIITVDNPPGWQGRAWVSVRGGIGTTTDNAYPIWTDAAPVVGARVCFSGAASRPSNCGVVTRTNVTVTYSGRRVTVAGLTEANFCAVAGDSGSPVFANHVAYGVVSGNAGNCITYFEPVQTVERLMNVNVAHDLG